jgi:predicted dehydrogenase
MGSSALKVALAGAGRLGTEVFMPLLRAMPGVSLAAVADADSAVLARVHAQNPDVVCCDDWRRIFDHGPVDAVIIALPSSQHAEAALECLARGIAVYIEKPMATIEAQARAIVDAQQRSGATAMVGFNYRANPLYASLRDRVEQAPGPVRMVRTVFTTPRHYHDGWRVSHETGGGVLFDLASHHFDLVRFLTGLGIREVAASSDGGRDGGERVSVSAILDSGAPLSATFGTGTIDQDQVEVIGDGWSVSADRYQSLTPDFRGAAVPGRAQSAMSGLASVRHAPYVLRKVREPWHEPSFRIALERFFAAARDRRAITPGAEDGLASLAAVLAAHESIETGRRVMVAPILGPARPDRPDRPGRTDRPDRPAPADRPALSAIVMVPARTATVRRSLDALAAQDVRNRIELVFVSPAETLDLPEYVGQFWGWTHVRIPRLDSTSEARAAGIRQARAPVIVLTEDHSFATPGWARALIDAHRGDWAAIGPAMLNANPATAVSWANLAIEYGPWLHPAAGGAATHVAGHNASYKRDVLLEYGDALGAMMEAESVLHWDLGRRGHRVAVASDARIRHENFSRLRPALAVKFNLGRMFAGNRAIGWPFWKRAIYTAGSPALPFVRTGRALRDLRRARAAQPLPVLATTLFSLLAANAAGELVGYLFGAGRAMQRLTRHEFDRKIYLTPRDQALMYPS